MEKFVEKKKCCTFALAFREMLLIDLGKLRK